MNLTLLKVYNLARAVSFEEFENYLSQPEEKTVPGGCKVIRFVPNHGFKK